MTDFIKILNEKTCASCTKCCEGYLSGTIHGHKMMPGTPCFFVEQGVGCKEYTTRPYDPCVTFQCEWRRNPHFEEWLAPAKTGVMFVRQVRHGFEYIKLIEAGKPASKEIIDWGLSYAEKNKLNFQWSVNGTFFSVGSIEFVKAMEN